ncbi:hypothetical protein Q1695_008655 [Nippostrongylus brasiliensis]|nr:hypothetical protein Q1695_008655 [Nippostrongylus brasiliensis]
MAALPVGFLVAVCICSALATDDGPTVEISGRTIRGLYMDVEQVKISAYLGVPFATAERFAKPTLIESYQGSDELDAKDLSKTCFQTPDSYFPGFLGSEMWNAPTELTEDCLSLNIWAPENPSGNVIVWIYGGGFFSGSPSLALYNGSVLAAKTKAVVVNINYRVGPFGFFYLGDDTKAPGNVGLLDQQVALQWIRKHISVFGGNSDKVTLFGESAGGASVTAHLLAPDSRDLFSKIIVNSGTIRNPWATRSSCRMLYFSMETAKGLGCAEEYEIKQATDPEVDQCTVKKPEVDGIYSCLLKKNKEDIQNISDTMYEHMRPMEWPFGPITRDDTFFKGDLRQKLKDGDYKRDVSAIFGTVKDEGTFWLPYYLYDSGFAFDPEGSEQENSAIIDEHNYTVSLKAFEGYFRNSSKALKILEDGFKGEEGKQTRYRDGVAQFVGDYFFSCSLDEFVDHIWTNLTSTYMYYFTVRSSANPWPKWMGVMHGYEIEYEFGYPFINESAYKELEKDKKASNHFIELIGEFVNKGSFDETKWPKYNADKKTLEIGEDPSVKKIQNDIYKKYCDVINKAKKAAIDEANDN